MRTSKAKAKQNPGFIPLTRCQYKLVESDAASRLMASEEEATRQVPEANIRDPAQGVAPTASPAYIDPAIRAPRDQLEEEEERARMVTAVTRLMTVLLAIAEKKRQQRRERERLLKKLERRCKFIGEVSNISIEDWGNDPDGYFSVSGSDTYRYKEHLRAMGGYWDRNLKEWIYPGERKSSVVDRLALLLGYKPEPEPKPKPTPERITRAREEIAKLMSLCTQESPLPEAAITQTYATLLKTDPSVSPQFSLRGLFVRFYPSASASAYERLEAAIKKARSGLMTPAEIDEARATILLLISPNPVDRRRTPDRRALPSAAP